MYMLDFLDTCILETTCQIRHNSTYPSLAVQNGMQNSWGTSPGVRAIFIYMQSKRARPVFSVRMSAFLAERHMTPRACGLRPVVIMMEDNSHAD